MALSDSEIAGAMSSAGFTGADIATGTAIALAESSGNPTATNHNTNGSTDYGLFQINSIHTDLLATGDWRDPVANARMAHTLFVAHKGWKDWATYNSGAYRIYMPRASVAAGNPSANLPANDSSATSTDGASGFSATTGFLSMLGSADTWRRLGLFLFGGILLFVGINKAIGDNKLSPITKAIGSAVGKKVAEAALA